MPRMQGKATARMRVRRWSVGARLAGACVVLACSMADARATRLAHGADPGLRAQRMTDALGVAEDVQDLAVDRDGYLWLATSDGVARHDGVATRFWRRWPGDARGLADNYATVLAVDAGNRVWVATWRGLHVIDADRGPARRIRPGREAGGCDADITALAAQGHGVWVATYAGRVCHVTADGRVRALRFQSGGGLPATALVTAMDAQPGALRVAGVGGAWQVLQGTRGARVVALHPAFDGERVHGLTTDADGVTWLGTDRALWRWEPRTAPAQVPWPERGAHAPRTLPASDGGAWWADARALWRVDHAGRVLAKVHGVPGGALAMREDPSGGLWVAAGEGGVFHVPRTHWSMVHQVLHSVGEGAHVAVAAPGAHDGHWWVAGSSGLWRIDATRGLRVRTATAHELGIGTPVDFATCAGRSGWLAGTRGLVRVAPDGRAARTPVRITRTPAHRYPQRVLCGARGEVWVAMYGGDIEVFDAAGRRMRALSAAQVTGGPGQDTAQLFTGPDGAPWLPARDRLRRWDGQAMVDVRVMPGEPIDVATTDARGEVWLARLGTVEQYQWHGHALRRTARFDARHGVPPVEAIALHVVPGGPVWVSTLRGLLRLDPASGSARLHGRRDGLPVLAGALVPGTRPDAPVLWVTDDALLQLAPAQIASVAPAAPLVVDAVDVLRGSRRIALPTRGEVQLGPGDRDLRVALRLLAYGDPARHRYQVRDAPTSPWADQGARAELVIAPSPGMHVIEARASADGGPWSATRRVVVRVAPPWWRTPWAGALALIACAGLLQLIAWWARQRQRRRTVLRGVARRKARAEAASRAKSRFLADLGHEVRTPMTGVLGMSELLLSDPLDERQRRRVEAIRASGEHLMRVLDDALELARIDAGQVAIAQVPFDLDALLASVAAGVQPLAERQGVAFTLHVPQPLGVCMGDATRVRQILLNLLGNALRHARVGAVLLEAVTHAGGVTVRVRDTGPGLGPAQQARLFLRYSQVGALRSGGQGLGLAISHALAERMGGTLAVDSVPGLGACFRFWWPAPRTATSPPLSR